MITPRLILHAGVPIFKMFRPSSKTARTHAHTFLLDLSCIQEFYSSILGLMTDYPDKFLLRFLSFCSEYPRRASTLEEHFIS
jgi:hypothetical protein